MRRGQRALAEEQLRIGMRALDQLTRPSVGTTISCLKADAAFAQGRGDLDHALTSIKDAIARAERAGETRGASYASLLSFQAALHNRRGELPASYEVSQRLRRLDEESGQAETVGFLMGLQNDAAVLAAMGEYQSARLIQESLATRWRAVTGDDAAPPWLGMGRARLMLKFGELDEAKILLEETVRRSQSLGNPDFAILAEFALAQVYVEQEQFEAAEQLLATRRIEATPCTGSLPCQHSRNGTRNSATGGGKDARRRPRNRRRACADAKNARRECGRCSLGVAGGCKGLSGSGRCSTRALFRN